MLVSDGFKSLREMKELIAFLLGYEIDCRFLPLRLKADEALDQIWVVSQLGVNNLYVLGVLFKQISHLKKRLLNFLSEGSDSLTLCR
jgi:hypothetical protein